MLKRRLQPLHPQRGIVLIMALIALVIMSIAAIGLTRTMSSSATLAGNLAFEQAAATSADQAVEAAIVWLENNSGQPSSATASTCASGGTVLSCDQRARGYAATRTDPSSTQTWSDLWAALIKSGFTAVTMGADVAGNQAAFLIQRMCNSAGDASTANGCSQSPMNLDTSGSRKAGVTVPSGSAQAYYRITVRVAGPRNTLTYTQVMVAL